MLLPWRKGEPLSWEFQPTSAAPSSRMFFAMSNLHPGTFQTQIQDISILYGGLCGGPDDDSGVFPYSSHKDTWMFNDRRAWEFLPQTARNTPPARFHHDMTSTKVGTVVMYGCMFYEGEGNNGIPKFYSDLWLFSIAEKQWSQLHPTPGVPQDGMPFNAPFIEWPCLHRQTTTTRWS